MRLERQLEPQRPRGESERIVCLGAGREFAGNEMVRHESPIETQGPEYDRFGRRRRGRGYDQHRPIDVHGAVAPRQVMDRTDASQTAKTLPRRRDLKRPHQHEQTRGKCLLREILQSVTYTRRAAQRRLGLVCADATPRSPKSRTAPASNPPSSSCRAVTVRPGEEPAADPQHGLDRERPLIHLDHAVFVHQSHSGCRSRCRRASTRSVRVQPARMPAARFAAGDVVPEGIDGTRELEGLHAYSGTGRRFIEFQTKESGLEAGQIDIAAFARPPASRRAGSSSADRCSNRGYESRSSAHAPASRRSSRRWCAARSKSIAIHGRRSSGRGFHPDPINAADASKPGSSLEAAAVGACVGLQSSIGTSAIHSVPLPPSPATMAISIEPRARRCAAARRDPRQIRCRGCPPSFASSAAASVRSFCTCRHTFWPVASTSLSSRLLTAPRPRRRKFTEYSSGMLRLIARRATTKPPPPLKSKSICNAGVRPADTADSFSSALPETMGCHSDGADDAAVPSCIGISSRRCWGLAKAARRASARHAARRADGLRSDPTIPGRKGEPAEVIRAGSSTPPKAARCLPRS